MNAQCIIPFAFWASFDAGIVNIQNRIQPIKPLGLRPVTDTYNLFCIQSIQVIKSFLNKVLLQVVLDWND